MKYYGGLDRKCIRIGLVVPMCIVMLMNIIFTQKYACIAQAVKSEDETKSIVISKGESYQLKIKKSNLKVKWNSSKSSVVVVSKKGEVKAKKRGTAVVTAESGKESYRFDVIVVSKKRAALSAYAQVLLQKKYSNGRKAGTDYYFSICDLNGDKIPEMLLLNDNSIWGIIGYYRYANGKVVKIRKASADESYPQWGILYELPDRRSFAFYRGGPATENYMPYVIMEYKVINNQIKLMHTVSLLEYTNSDKEECFFDGKRCKAEVFEEMLKSAKQIKYLPNTKANLSKYEVNSPTKRLGVIDEDKTMVRYYTSNLSETKGSKKNHCAGIRKVIFKRDKITFYSSFIMSHKPMFSRIEGMWCKYKKRTFRLAKKVRYYGVGGEGPKKVYSADEFQDICLAYNCLDLEIKLKNNKVVSMTVKS